MKMLLTSTGLSTPKIAHEFFSLIVLNIPKDPSQIKIAFIPTAAVSDEEKEHAEQSKQQLLTLGIKEENINIVNVDHVISFEELKNDDAMFVCGGNTFYLLNQMKKMNFEIALNRFLSENKLYVGVSAGSIVVTPSIDVANVEPADPNDVGLTDFTGLNIVDFEVSPHVPEVVSYESVEKYSHTTKNKIYAFDHDCALTIHDNKVGFVGDGKHSEYN